MKKLSRIDNKKIVLSLLQKFDAICRENGIKYSLSGGSLLGAVRHKGFIPWDDDADVMLTRDNYEKIKEILKNYNDASINFIDEDSNGYYYAFSKLCDNRTYFKTLTPQDADIENMGVYIDIFPIDRIPAKEQEQYEFCKKSIGLLWKVYYSIPGFYYRSNSSLKRGIKKILYFPKYAKFVKNNDTKELLKQLVKQLQQFKNTNAEMGGYILSEYGKKEIIPYSTFINHKDIEFEGNTFMSIADTDTYLSALFGEYMQLPPKNQRQPKHEYIGYWK